MSLAIINSSLVGITNAFTLHPGLDISLTFPLTLLASLSTSTPRYSNPFKHASLVSGPFSPTPAVKTNASIFIFNFYIYLLGLNSPLLYIK